MRTRITRASPSAGLPVSLSSDTGASFLASLRSSLRGFRKSGTHDFPSAAACDDTRTSTSSSAARKLQGCTEAMAASYNLRGATVKQRFGAAGSAVANRRAASSVDRVAAPDVQQRLDHGLTDDPAVDVTGADSVVVMIVIAARLQRRRHAVVGPFLRRSSSSN